VNEWVSWVGGWGGRQGGRGGEETYLSGARLVSPGRRATTETRTAMLGLVACVRVCVEVGMVDVGAQEE
jgi:hypothetical protein